MTAPEKIYGWRDTQLSIARHYGGCKFNGASYTIDVNDPDQPLVRDDILKAEVKAKKKPSQPSSRSRGAGMSQSDQLPGCLHEDLCRSVEVLERILLEKP